MKKDRILKYISHVIPFTRKEQTTFNGMLEITWMDGKKVLDASNSNYSYGSLQRILTRGLKEIPFRKTRRLLLLGMGGGSVIRTLRTEFGFTGIIDAVEFDPDIIRIAREEFQIHADETLNIHCCDALQYIDTNTHKYELIIIDLFIDDKVPEPFLNNSFISTCMQQLDAGGHCLFNFSMHEEERLAAVKQSFPRVRVLKQVLGSNTLLIFKN